MCGGLALAEVSIFFIFYKYVQSIFAPGTWEGLREHRGRDVPRSIEPISPE